MDYEPETTTEEERKSQCCVYDDELLDVLRQLTRILNTPVQIVIPNYNSNLKSRHVLRNIIFETEGHLIKASVYDTSHINQEDFEFHHKTDKIKYSERHVHFSVLGVDPGCEYDFFINFYTQDEFEKIIMGR